MVELGGSVGGDQEAPPGSSGVTTCPPRFSVLAPSLQLVNCLPNYFIFARYNLLFFVLQISYVKSLELLEVPTS